MAEAPPAGRPGATTSSSRRTPTPPRTAWSTSSPTSTRRTVRRWPPSGTCPRSPSPCSEDSIPATSTSPTRCAPRPPVASPAWVSTSTPPPDGWPTTAPTGWCRATAAGGVSRSSRSRASTPRSPCPARSWPAGCRPPCTWAPRPTRGSRWCGPRCTAICAGSWTSAPPHPDAGPGCMPIDFHDMDRAVEEVAWARPTASSAG